MFTKISRCWLSSAVLMGLLVLFTSACQSQVSTPEKPLPPESAPATSTATPLLPSPTATSTQDPFELTKQVNLTQNAAHQATSDALATNIALTPSPTPPPSPTPTTTSPPLPPTPTDEEQAWSAAVMAATAPESLQVFTSPDQSWQAEVVRYECTLVSEAGGELAYELLLLTGPDGEVTPVAQQLQFCGGLGAAGINGLFWSPDGKYFYFDMAREGVPDGMPCRYWHTGKSRLNMETLEVEVLPGKGLVSPDGFSLLLVAEPDFILWDLNQGEVGRSAHPYPGLSVKSIAFSAEGSRAVYVLREDCIQPGADSVVVVLNLADLTHTIALESSAPSILYATWESDNNISLLAYGGESFELSLSTGEITPR